MIDLFTTDEAPEPMLDAIRGLLDDAFEGAFTEDDWLHTLGGHHVTVRVGETLVAHGAVVHRRLEVGNRSMQVGYVEGVATAAGHRRRGHGSELMREIAGIVTGAHEMGALSTGVQAFYESLGWERWLGRTSVRRGPIVTRTPDDDGGIMVLRFGRSAGIDLRADLVCEERPGDVW